MSTFAEKLRAAAQGSVAASSLLFLSDLGSDDRDDLRREWPGLPLESRRGIVSRLVTLAEDNIELDFRYVFLTALDDIDPGVRLTAIEGLYEDESKLLLNALLRLLRDDFDDDVRAAATQAMGRFAYLGQCEKLGSAASDLRDALLLTAQDNDEDEDVRRRAVEALGYYSGDAVIEQIIAGLYEGGGKGAESAVFAMGRSFDPKWELVVVYELESKRPAMRFEAARAAGELGLQDALPFLVRMADDPDIEIRLAAIQSLGQIGSKPAKEALARALESKERTVREAAQEALDELNFNANPLH